MAVHGVAKSRTRLSNFTFTFHFHILEKEMATHSSVLAWRIPGTGEPGGLPSMGSHGVGHDWSDLAAAAAAYHHLSFAAIFFLILEQLSNSNLPVLDLVTLQMGFHIIFRVMFLKGLLRGLLKCSSSHLSDLPLPCLQNLPLPVKATVHLVLPYHLLQTFVHTFPYL